MDIIHQHFKINFRNHFVKVQAERNIGRLMKTYLLSPQSGITH